MTVQEHLDYLTNNVYVDAVELVTTGDNEKYVTVHFTHKAGAVLYCEFFGVESSVKNKLIPLMQPEGAVYLTLNFSKMFKVYNDRGHEVEGVNIDKNSLEVIGNKKYKWASNKEIRCVDASTNITQYVIVDNIWYNIPKELAKYVQAAIGFNCKRYLVVRKEAIKCLTDVLEEYCNAD